MSPAVFWAGFHLRRNLGRRGTLVWVIALPLVVAVMRLGFDVPVDAVGQLTLVYLVPLMSLAFGGGVLREEVEDQTLTYGFTRPLPRASIYWARLFAAAGPVVLATLPAAALAATGVVDGLRLGAAVVLGTAAHASLFGVVGLLTRRPTWVGLAYVLVWEQALQAVPGWLSTLTLRTHLRNLGGLDLPGGMPGVSAADPGPWWLSALVLAAVAAVCIGLAGAIVGRRELVLTR
ncbi:MAG: hypothetical protein AB1Z98_04675 [Nannocystaceae bacterium]